MSDISGTSVPATPQQTHVGLGKTNIHIRQCCAVCYSCRCPEVVGKRSQKRVQAQQMRDGVLVTDPVKVCCR